MTNDEGDEPELLMPFVTVRSVGGEHDDDSYTAGWEMGALDVRLALSGEPTITCTLHTENRPQARPRGHEERLPLHPHRHRRWLGCRHIHEGAAAGRAAVTDFA